MDATIEAIRRIEEARLDEYELDALVREHGSGDLFHHNVRGYRVEAKVSQERLAERMRDLGFKHFSQATVWAIEKGQRSVPVDESLALARALGVPFVWMFLPSWAYHEREKARFQAQIPLQRAILDEDLRHLNELVWGAHGPVKSFCTCGRAFTTTNGASVHATKAGGLPDHYWSRTDSDKVQRRAEGDV